MQEAEQPVFTPVFSFLNSSIWIKYSRKLYAVYTLPNFCLVHASIFSDFNTARSIIIAKTGNTQNACLILSILSNKPIKKGITIPPAAPRDIMMPTAVPLYLLNLSEVMDIIMGQATEKPKPIKEKLMNPIISLLTKSANMILAIDKNVPINKNIIPFFGNIPARKRPKIIPVQ